AQLAGVREQADRARITAPMSGIVAQRAVNAGDVVTPGMPMFTIVDPASMRLVAAVPADQLASIRVGIPVSFTVNGYPNRTFTGRVSRVNPTVDPATRQVQIVVSIPNAGNTLVGGLFAQGKAASEAHTGLVVPLRAIDERAGRPAVVRVKAGVAQRVDVQVGLRDEDLGVAEVKGAIAAGDTVLVGPAMAITNGTPVQVSTVRDQGPGSQRPNPVGTTSAARP
ncbi:MAG TPA: efflux RND transporter periplasmic adaptor subunit, partial [Gemmatimonadaceae bacterium]|nr:efflux RND transporter periplasmic adaptor subunit [Gemmatimonadaceae bacterium]